MNNQNYPYIINFDTNNNSSFDRILTPKTNYNFVNKFSSNTKNNKNVSNSRNGSKEKILNKQSNYKTLKNAVSLSKERSTSKNIRSKNSSFENSHRPATQTSVNDYLQRRHYETEQKLMKIKNDKIMDEIKEVKLKPKISENSRKIVENIGHNNINVFDRLTNKSLAKKRELEIKKIEEMNNQNYEKPKINDYSSHIQRSIDDLLYWKQNLIQKREYQMNEMNSNILTKPTTNKSSEDILRERNPQYLDTPVEQRLIQQGLMSKHKIEGKKSYYDDIHNQHKHNQINKNFQIDYSGSNNFINENLHDPNYINVSQTSVGNLRKMYSNNPNIQKEINTSIINMQNLSTEKTNKSRGFPSPANRMNKGNLQTQPNQNNPYNLKNKIESGHNSKNFGLYKNTIEIQRQNKDDFNTYDPNSYDKYRNKLVSADKFTHLNTVDQIVNENKYNRNYEDHRGNFENYENNMSNIQHDDNYNMGSENTQYYQEYDPNLEYEEIKNIPQSTKNQNSSLFEKKNVNQNQTQKFNYNFNTISIAEEKRKNILQSEEILKNSKSKCNNNSNLNITTNNSISLTNNQNIISQNYKGTPYFNTSISSINANRPNIPNTTKNANSKSKNSYLGKSQKIYSSRDSNLSNSARKNQNFNSSLKNSLSKKTLENEHKRNLSHQKNLKISVENLKEDREKIIKSFNSSHNINSEMSTTEKMVDIRKHLNDYYKTKQTDNKNNYYKEFMTTNDDSAIKNILGENIVTNNPRIEINEENKENCHKNQKFNYKDFKDKVLEDYHKARNVNKPNYIFNRIGNNTYDYSNFNNNNCKNVNKNENNGIPQELATPNDKNIELDENFNVNSSEKKEKNYDIYNFRQELIYDEIKNSKFGIDKIKEITNNTNELKNTIYNNVEKNKKFNEDNNYKPENNLKSIQTNTNYIEKSTNYSNTDRFSNTRIENSNKLSENAKNFQREKENFLEPKNLNYIPYKASKGAYERLNKSKESQDDKNLDNESYHSKITQIENVEEYRNTNKGKNSTSNNREKDLNSIMDFMNRLNIENNMNVNTQANKMDYDDEINDINCNIEYINERLKLNELNKNFLMTKIHGKK